MENLFLYHSTPCVQRVLSKEISPNSIQSDFLVGSHLSWFFWTDFSLAWTVAAAVPPPLRMPPVSGIDVSVCQADYCTGRSQPDLSAAPQWFSIGHQGQGWLGAGWSVVWSVSKEDLKEGDLEENAIEENMVGLQALYVDN